MPRPAPPPDLAQLSLGEIARLAAEQRLPPIESWAPQHCGPSAMVIRRDGSWLHEGRPIARPEMVRLFSTLLRREPDGRIVLVTPVEKLDIDVEDTPFVAVEMKSEGTGRERQLAFRLNSGELVLAGTEHPLRVEPGPDGPRPLLVVRHGLDARIGRSAYYELVELALAEGSDPPGLWSGGSFFALDDRQ